MDPIRFQSDTTIRWSCRAGDYIIWLDFNAGVFSDGQYVVNDLWKMQDGNFVTLTNRQIDLPMWFELHPLEVSGAMVYWMQKKLNSGYKPTEIIDGPNIWRLFTGNRLVWVGKSRPGLESNDGILAIVNFEENALIIGEPFIVDNEMPLFGALEDQGQSDEDILLCRKGCEAALNLGIPRHIANTDKWTIG